MDFEKYKVPYTLGRAPSRPLMPRRSSPADVRKFADALEQHAKEREEYKRQVSEYHDRQNQMDRQFRVDALREVGLANHPKREKAFDFAWEHGHAMGYSEVYSWLREIAELLKDDSDDTQGR